MVIELRGPIHLKAHSRSADVTTVTEPRPDAPDGEAPRRPAPPSRPSPSRPTPPSRPAPARSPRPPGPTTLAGVSLPPEPIDLLLGKVRDRDVDGRPRVGPDPGPVGSRAPAGDPLVAGPSGDPEWTFRPDDAPAPTIGPTRPTTPNTGPPPPHRIEAASLLASVSWSFWRRSSQVFWP